MVWSVYGKNCESSSASHLGVHERGVVCDQRWGAASSGVPSRDPSALIWSHPKWFIKWYWWPKEVLGRQPKPQAFPPPIPTIGGWESEYFPKFIFSLLCWNHAIIQTASHRCISKEKPEICLLTSIRQRESCKHVTIFVVHPGIRLCFSCTFRSKSCIRAWKTPASKVAKLLPVPDSNLAVTQSLHGAFCVQTSPLSHFSPGACGLHSACRRHKLSK